MHYRGFTVVEKYLPVSWVLHARQGLWATTMVGHPYLSYVFTTYVFS